MRKTKKDWSKLSTYDKTLILVQKKGYNNVAQYFTENNIFDFNREIKPLTR